MERMIFRSWPLFHYHLDRLQNRAWVWDGNPTENVYRTFCSNRRRRGRSNWKGGTSSIGPGREASRTICVATKWHRRWFRSDRHVNQYLGGTERKGRNNRFYLCWNCFFSCSFPFHKKPSTLTPTTWNATLISTTTRKWLCAVPSFARRINQRARKLISRSSPMPLSVRTHGWFRHSKNTMTYFRHRSTILRQRNQ